MGNQTHQIESKPLLIFTTKYAPNVVFSPVLMFYYIHYDS